MHVVELYSQYPESQVEQAVPDMSVYTEQCLIESYAQYVN